MDTLIQQRMIIKVSVLLCLFVILAVPFNTVSAKSITGENVVLDADKTLEKTSFLAGNSIRIDGDINATTFASGSTVKINGMIDGDVFAAAQTVIINGTVKGSLITAAQNVTVNGSIENNIYAAGQTLNLASQTDGSVFLAGQMVHIEEAAVQQDAFIGAGNIQQDGIIQGDFSSSSDLLRISGEIGGDLKYRSKEKAELSNSANVAGETTWNQVKSESKLSSSKVTALTFLFPIFSVLAALLIWFVFRLLRRTLWTDFSDQITTKPLITLGVGIGGVIVVPILAFLLIVTIIGFPLSLILLLFYGLSLYLSKIILAVYIGNRFQNKYNWSNGKGFWVFLLGLIILVLITKLPFIGWLLSLIIVSFGFGSILLFLNDKRRKRVA